MDADISEKRRESDLIHWARTKELWWTKRKDQNAVCEKEKGIKLNKEQKRKKGKSKICKKEKYYTYNWSKKILQMQNKSLFEKDTPTRLLAPSSVAVGIKFKGAMNLEIFQCMRTNFFIYQGH